MRPGIVLVAIVLVSAVVHELAARRLTGLWIFPDEGVYALRGLGFWQHGTSPGVGYGVLYPILLGLPLSIGTLHTGYELTKVVQSIVVSLAAVPVYLYGRRLMSERYALVAAAFTVASPLLLYSGLLMTEVLFYPLAACTMLAIARAVATGGRRNVGVALVLIVACVLTRTQAVVFVAVFALAVCCDAVFARSVTRLRPLWPLAVLLLVGAVVIAARPSVLGSYAVTVRGSYPVGSAVRLSLEDLALVVFSTAVLPAAALCLSLVDGVRERLRDAQFRALVATALAAVLVLPAQVGIFAARFAPHLLERDLAPLPPLLFTFFAAWFARGRLRPFSITAVVVIVLGALLLLPPWNKLAQPIAFPDSFSLTLLYHVDPGHPVLLAVILVPVLLLAFALVPRRASVLLLAVPFALLVATSVVASNTVAQSVQAAQRDMVGPVPGWIDRDVPGDVAYFYDNEAYWNVVWQERFWNPHITQILASEPTAVPGPLPQTLVPVPPDGRLPIHERYVVSTDYHHFVGTPVAHLVQTSLDATGLTLWKLDGPPRLSFETFGFDANGNITFPGTVKVFDCGGGTLHLTLLTKETSRLRIRLDGKLVVDQRVEPNSVWNGSIPAPHTKPATICNYEIVPQQLLGSTQILFDRP